jgi:O-antigen/teichoic acid export membrane protein
MQLRLSATQSNLLSNIGALLSGTLLARALGMVGLILLARIVGPADYGHFAASLAVIKLAAVLFSLGLDHWLLRYGGREQQSGALTIHGASCLVIKVGLGALWWMALALVAPWLDQAAFPMTIVLLVGLTVWLEEVANVAWTMYNSASANKTAALLLTVYQFLQLVAIVCLAGVGVQSLRFYLLGQLVAALVGCAFSLYRLQRDFGFALDWADVRTTLRGSIPFATSLALALIYGRADITIVAAWLGSADVGIYAPAVSLVMTLLLIPLSIYSVVLPPLSRAHAEDRTALQRLAMEVTLGSALVGIVTGGALALSADLVVRLIFGPQYLAVGTILVILSGVVVLRCISFAVAAVLTAVGWQTQRTLVQTVVAAANVGLNLLLVTRWGVVGVAWIFVLTDALLLLGYLGLVLYWRQWVSKGEIERLSD